MQLLIYVLVALVVFACLGFGLKWVCDTFFNGVRPAYWICGVILVILLVVAASYLFTGAGGETFHFPR